MVRRLRADTGWLLGEPWRALSGVQVSRFWLGPAAAAVVLWLTEVAGTGWGHTFLARWAIMRGDEPWWLTLEKVPLSVLAPAYLLPCGFAMLQVFVVLGASQVHIGTPRTLAVGLAGHVTGSFSLRAWVWLGPPVGLPAKFLHLPDAGPSVAVIAIGVFLAVRLRVLWLATLLLAYHIGEWFVIAGIAQREHLVGALLGALVALSCRYRPARRPSTLDTPDPLDTLDEPRPRHEPGRTPEAKPLQPV